MRLFRKPLPVQQTALQSLSEVLAELSPGAHSRRFETTKPIDGLFIKASLAWAEAAG